MAGGRRSRLSGMALDGSQLLPAESSRGRVEAMRYQDITAIEPGKRGGKPCIRGDGITVRCVQLLGGGMTEQQILRLPYLTAEDIQRAMVRRGSG
jgi:uncharacterized protein (DUF433 family)